MQISMQAFGKDDLFLFCLYYAFLFVNKLFKGFLAFLLVFSNQLEVTPHMK